MNSLVPQIQPNVRAAPADHSPMPLPSVAARRSGGMKLLDRLAGRHVLLFAIVLGALVSLPTLGSGLFLDDYQQRIALLGGGPDNVFEFFHRGTPATEAQLQGGVLPWWTHPQTKVVFYRPVAQALMKLDYRFWPDNLAAMHLHSVLWYLVAVLVAGLTYRRMMPTPWVAGLAAILFAVDAAHGPVVAWLANRNALVGLTGALLSLLCYRQRRWTWQILGCGLFAFSLACCEGALAITGYCFAYEMFLSDRRWHQRFLRLLPYALLAMSWLAFWKVHGFGTSGPGFYIDPASDPSLFLAKMVVRFPAYLAGQFFLPPAELFAASEDSGLQAVALAYAVAVVALLAWLFLPLLRSSPLARFYGLGLLIAVIPICGSAPVSRSLWFVGFGATGLLALLIGQYRSLPMSPARPRGSTILAGTMTVLHLWVSPLLFVAYSKAGDVGDGLMDSRRAHLPVDGTPGRKVLALSTASYIGNITFPLLKDQALSLGAAPTRGAPSIARIRALSEGQVTFDLAHPDADTLVVTCPAGFTTLRPSHYGFTPGDRVLLDDVEVVVRSVSPSGAPTMIEYRFSPGALPGYEIIAWRGDRFEPATLPPIGSRVSITTGAS